MTRRRRFILAGGVLAALFTAAPASGQAVAQTPANFRPRLENAARRCRRIEGVEKTDAIAALATLGTRPEVVKLIETCLEDKEPTVRQTAADALGEIESRRSIPKLKQAMKDDNADVSFTAARVLWEMGDRSGRSMFLDVLAGERK